MRASRRDVLIGLASGLAAPAVAAPAIAAEKYPVRPVRLISGFPAGGAVDITARVIADWMSSDLGQQVYVEDRGGSGGNIGAQAAITSPPDGYTLLFDAPNNAISASLYKKLPFDFIRDTVPVAGIMRLTNIMVVPPSMPWKTVADFIAYGKANPGKLSFASSGNGTSVHMSGELFKAMTGVDMLHVPYRGAAGAYPDLMTGEGPRAVRQFAGLDRVRAHRPIARARGDGREALAGAAGHPGDRARPCRATRRACGTAFRRRAARRRRSSTSSTARSPPGLPIPRPGRNCTSSAAFRCR